MCVCVLTCVLVSVPVCAYMKTIGRCQMPFCLLATLVFEIGFLICLSQVERDKMLAWRGLFETSKSTPSDILPPARLHLLTLLKPCYPLITKHLDIRTHGEED